MLLPSSKYLTNRDLILAVLSKGTTTLSGIFESEDAVHLIEGLRILGFSIEIEGNVASIEGGIFHMKGKNQEINVGNHGTITRFLAALSILNTVGTITLVHDEDEPYKKDFSDIVDALTQLGIGVTSDNGCLPITITPTKKRLKKEIRIDGNTGSLMLMALLEIAPCLPFGLIIDIEGDLINKSYVDLTIHEMNKFHVSVVNQDYKRFIIQPQVYHYQNILIEGDASALSYPVAYKILHGGTMTIDNLGTSTKQGEYGFLRLVELFGLKHKSDMKTTTFIAPGIKNVDLSSYAGLILDGSEMPGASMTCMILSLFLPGQTTIVGLESLNQKENKRIEVMAAGFRALDVSVSTTERSITIGEINVDHVKHKAAKEGIHIDTYADHRIAMAFGVLNNYLGYILDISDPESVGKTYPTFWEDLQDTTIQ